MTTCKDCIHFDACENMSVMRMHLPTIAYQIVDTCVAFKDKSKFIELPCKTTDKLYIINDFTYKRFIEEREFSVFHIKGTNDFSRELWDDTHGGQICNFADFGKTVFLTREEAEKAIKECENK